MDSLTNVPAERKCFRLINGVLVERTVGDVVPALETNATGLKSVLEGLVKEYKKKQEEMEEWKVSLVLRFPGRTSGAVLWGVKGIIAYINRELTAGVECRRKIISRLSIINDMELFNEYINSVPQL